MNQDNKKMTTKTKNDTFKTVGFEDIDNAHRHANRVGGRVVELGIGFDDNTFAVVTTDVLTRLIASGDTYVAVYPRCSSDDLGDDLDGGTFRTYEYPKGW